MQLILMNLNIMEILEIKIRRELGVKDKLVIGHVGRFNKQKNHDF